MSYLEALILGIVQGLTEFLPISSSAHLIMAEHLLGRPFGAEDDVQRAFDVLLHLGTLTAAVAYFREDVNRLGRGILRGVRGSRDEDARTGLLVLVATLPVVVIALVADGLIQDLRTAHAAAIITILFTLPYFLADRLAGSRELRDIGLWMALWVGVAQALALAPGVSRSGITIAAAMLAGMSRHEAARLSFLMSIPVTVAAIGKESLVVVDAVAADASFLGIVVVGVITSAVTGFLAIAWMLRFLRGHALSWFALYRIPLGVGFLAWVSLTG